MLITSTSINKRVQHSLVLLEYYSDMVAIGQQDGVPGIPKQGID